MEIVQHLEGDNILSAHSHRRFDKTVEICSVLADVLNGVHGSDFSNRFWEILIFPYAAVTISQHKTYGSASFSPAPEFEEMNGFVMASLKEKVKITGINLVKRAKQFNSFSKTRQLLQKHNGLTFGFLDLPVIHEELGEPVPDNFLFMTGSGNKSLREKLNIAAAGYESVFLQNVIRQVPKVYVEFFEKIFSWIPLFEPEKKSLHVHLFFGVYNRMLIAKYVENGARFCWYQHGAFYGEVKGAMHLERRQADELRTWGWKITGKDVPWKAYRLQDFYNQYRAAPQKRKYDFLMCFPDLSEMNEKPYREKAAYFLENISKEKYHHFIARPRPLNKVFSHAHKIHFMKHDKRVVIDSGLGSMPGIIASCRLVIQFSVPGTNFLECVYADHPAVGLLENNDPTEIVMPFYNFFLEKGVLHHDFESLVAHLNRIDIETWWDDIVSHPVYKDFKNTFARQV